MIPTSDLCQWSPQNHSLRVLKSAGSTHGPEGEWFLVTVTVTQISATPAWRTDLCPLGSRAQNVTSLEGTQVAAWSHPGWGLPDRPAISLAARAAWAVRQGQVLQIHREAPYPGLSPGYPAKGIRGQLPVTEVASCPPWAEAHSLEEDSERDNRASLPEPLSEGS